MDLPTVIIVMKVKGGSPIATKRAIKVLEGPGGPQGPQGATPMGVVDHAHFGSLTVGRRLR